MEEKKYLNPNQDLYIIFGCERLDFFSKRYRERVCGLRLYLADPLSLLDRWERFESRLKRGYEVFSLYSSISGGAPDLSHKLVCLPGLYYIQTRLLDPRADRVEISRLEFAESVSFCTGVDNGELIVTQ